MMTRTFVKSLMYNLKRDYGRRILVIKHDDPAVDYKTGRQTVPRRYYEVKRGIVLEDHFAKLVLTTLQTRSSMGNVQNHQRLLLIDGVDLPSGLTLTTEGSIGYQNTRYKINEVQSLIDYAAYLLKIEAVEPMPAFQFDLSESISFGDSANEHK